MAFQLDDEFRHHFRNLQQVFLYITDDCNLRCAQCLYKPSLTFHVKTVEIELHAAVRLLETFIDMGACKVSLLGGEPTRYGMDKGNQPLLQLISEAKSMGYEYVRMSTNGVFEDSLLQDNLRGLDELTFSLDGPTATLNDPLRGIGTFSQCVANIRRAVDLGYNVNVTCCVHRALMQRGQSGRLVIDEMIRFVAELGARRVNFHDLIRAHLPMDTWTVNLAPAAWEWVEMYREIRGSIEEGEYPISVRLPQCFVTRQEFADNPEYFGYCPAKLGERVLVHPNGIVRICSNLLATPYGVAKYYGQRISWDHSPTNELGDHALELDTPCTNRGKRNLYGDLVPLCFSFKPGQDEFIWRHKLNWDARRKTRGRDAVYRR